MKDRHFRIALPGGKSVRQVMLFGPAAEPFTAETSVDGPADTTMDGPGHPRTAPRRGSPRAAPDRWRHGTVPGKPTLTAPDGTVHDLVLPRGDGNGFWAARAQWRNEAGIQESGQPALRDRSASWLMVEGFPSRRRPAWTAAHLHA
ncbi:hypothetical protein ACFV8Z_09690 [Streptomyces sp. NPDC059837]|uniref:hypothetical protein n=1 Tax=unclassified Streptomyces TaxID=2593676 RepID=UPI003657F374